MYSPPPPSYPPDTADALHALDALVLGDHPPMKIPTASRWKTLQAELELMADARKGRTT